MKRTILTGMTLLTLSGCAWAGEQCVEENARVQAAVTQAQNGLVQVVVLQGQIALLKDQLKALQDEKAKASNPKAESAAEPTPDNVPNNAPAQ